MNHLKMYTITAKSQLDVRISASRLLKCLFSARNICRMVWILSVTWKDSIYFEMSEHWYEERGGKNNRNQAYDDVTYAYPAVTSLLRFYNPVAGDAAQQCYYRTRRSRLNQLKKNTCIDINPDILKHGTVCKKHFLTISCERVWWGDMYYVCASVWEIVQMPGIRRKKNEFGSFM